MQHVANYRVEEAERVLLQILASHPESTRVRDELRWMYFNQFRHKELDLLLEEGLRVRPGDLSLAVNLLMSEFRPQNPREVLVYWERVARQQRNQPRVLVTLAFCYSRVGDADKAEQSFQAALDLGNADIFIRVRVAEFLIDQGDFAVAEQVLNWGNQTVAQSSSDSVYQDQVLWQQSLIAESRGDLIGALKYIDRALEREPSKLSYIQRRGALLQRLGRSDAAADCFARANQHESYIGRLSEIVLSGELESPTADLCREIASICEQRGKMLQADAWNRAASRVGT